MDILEDINLIHAENGKYGVPNQEILIKWLANKTDLLIVSYSFKELLIKYLCAASNSKLKSSIKHPKVKPSDLDIDLWVDPHQDKTLLIRDQCELIFDTIAKLGMKAPLIGE